MFNNFIFDKSNNDSENDVLNLNLKKITLLWS